MRNPIERHPILLCFAMTLIAAGCDPKSERVIQVGAFNTLWTQMETDMGSVEAGLVLVRLERDFAQTIHIDHAKKHPEYGVDPAYEGGYTSKSLSDGQAYTIRPFISGAYMYQTAYAPSGKTIVDEPPLTSFYILINRSEAPNLDDVAAKLEGLEEVIYAEKVGFFSPMVEEKGAFDWFGFRTSPNLSPCTDKGRQNWTLMGVQDAWKVREEAMKRQGRDAFGSDTLVCIVDTGVESSHRLLANFVDTELAVDLIPENGRDRLKDSDLLGWHGTKVAGVIAGGEDDDEGRIGIFPTKLVVVNACAIGDAFASNYVDGVYWGIAHGARVINLSMERILEGTRIKSNCSEFDSECDLADYLAKLDDVIVLAASGNQASKEPWFPAGLGGVTEIGGSDCSGCINRTVRTASSTQFLAPSVAQICTTTGDRLNDGVDKNFQGTSAATAHASAAMAFLWDTYPWLTSREVLNAFQSSAFQCSLGSVKPKYGQLKLQSAMKWVAANGLDVEPKELP